MRHWINQPEGSKLCGQIAVAVVAKTSLKKVIKLIGHEKATTTRELAKALHALGYKCPMRCVRISKNVPISNLAICHLRTDRKSGWHWVVKDGIRFYDGCVKECFGKRGEVDWPSHWRITSFLPITEK